MGIPPLENLFRYKPRTKSKHREVMDILHISSEFAPCMKIGGLADMVAGLCRETKKSGHRVEVLLPFYKRIDKSSIQNLHLHQDPLFSYSSKEWISNRIWKGRVCGIPVTFIEDLHPDTYFARPDCYGYEDDIVRFTYFSRAALEYMCHSPQEPDVLHLHDWQTALIAPMYQELYPKSKKKKAKVIFTIHNNEHQGWCQKKDLEKLGLNGEYFMHPSRLLDNHRPHNANLLKGGIVYSDAVNTVSPTYATESLRSDGGKGLETSFQKYQSKYSGILNGIDHDVWNPQTDVSLSCNFSHKTPENKKQNTHFLREKLHLAQEDRPLVTTIARLVPQKGVDLIKHALFRSVEKGGQFVLLGFSPIPSIREEFMRLQQQFADHPHVHLQFEHDEALAHQVFAASDIFIVPSLFEPCGLTQIFAMRYGSIPVVRKTGGLADTVFDLTFSDQPEHLRNGYTFDFPDVQGLNFALDRAIDDYQKKPQMWKQLVSKVMTLNYGWKKPCQKYLQLYTQTKSQF